MTKPKPLEELERPRRYLGMALRSSLHCPLCKEQNLRIVAYRRRTARLECRTCKFRFSVDVVSFALKLLHDPELVFSSNPGAWALVTVFAGMEPNEESAAECREMIRQKGEAAFEAHLRALGTWETFVEAVSKK